MQRPPVGSGGEMVIGFLASDLGWKLNPVVGAVYGPEFYAGKRLKRWSGAGGGGRGRVGVAMRTGRGLEGRGHWRQTLWDGVPSPYLCLPAHTAPLPPALRSDGVPLPHHGHGRGLQGRAPAGPGPGRVQYVPGCAAPAPHPRVWSVSTREPREGGAETGPGGVGRAARGNQAGWAASPCMRGAREPPDLGTAATL